MNTKWGSMALAKLVWIHHLHHGTRNTFKQQLFKLSLVILALDFPVLLLHLCSSATGTFMDIQPIEQAAFSSNSLCVPWNSAPARPLSLCHGCILGLVSIPVSGSISFSSWLGSLDGSQTWLIPCCFCHCFWTPFPGPGGTDPMCWGHFWLSALCP